MPRLRNSPRTNTTLLEAAAAGEREARSTLLELAAGIIARRAQDFVRQKSLSHEDAEEIANDTLFRLHTAMEQEKYSPILPDGRHAFHAYVRTAFSNASIDRLRQISRRRTVNARDLSEGGDLTQFEDETSPQADRFFEEESKEYTEAVCFALAMRSIDVVRRRLKKPEETGDEQGDDEIANRDVAWRGFCLMVLEGKSRDEVVERLTSHSKAGKDLAKTVTPDWLSARAYKIRRRLWRTFKELGTSILGADESSLRESLSAMLGRIGYDDLAAAIREIANPEDSLVESDLASMDELLARAQASLKSDRPLKRMTEHLVVRATKLSHH